MNLADQLVAWHSTVAGKREPHAAHAGDRGHTAQPHCATDNNRDDVRENRCIQIRVDDVEYGRRVCRVHRLGDGWYSQCKRKGHDKDYKKRHWYQEKYAPRTV